MPYFNVFEMLRYIISIHVCLGGGAKRSSSEKCVHSLWSCPLSSYLLSFPPSSFPRYVPSPILSLSFVFPSPRGQKIKKESPSLARRKPMISESESDDEIQPPVRELPAV